MHCLAQSAAVNVGSRGFHFRGVFETAEFAAFILKILTVSQFPTEFGASPHNTTVSLRRCDLADSVRTAQLVLASLKPVLAGSRESAGQVGVFTFGGSLKRLGLRRSFRKF
jgi:hypothetical protein